MRAYRPIRFNILGAVHKVRYAIFGHFLPPPSVTLRHTSRDPPESTSHISDPPIIKKPSTKNPDKSPLVQILSQLFEGFCPGVLSEGILSGRFCPGWFCPFSFCQNTSVTTE